MIRKIICVTDGEEFPLHDPSDRRGTVRCIDPVLTLEMGKAGSLTFTIQTNHPYKDKINVLKSIIKVTEEGNSNPIFVGRHVGDSYDFYNSGKVECEGALAYFNDSIQRPFSHEYDDGGFIEELIRVHNSQVEEAKQFTYGKATVNSGSFDRVLESADTTMSVLKSMVTDYGAGYINVRHEDGTMYIDYVESYGDDNNQVVRFGENLLDLTKSTDPTTIVTALIPYGATDDDGNVLDIKSVNNDLDYIVDTAAVEKYGYIWGTETFDDCTEAEQLLKKAQARLEELCVLTSVIEANAVDMNLVSSDMESFKLGCYTRIISEPHDLDTKMLLTKKVLNLNNPENDTFTFGGETQSFVGANDKTQTSLGLKVETIAGSLDKDIDKKVDNATNLINGGMGGYIYTHTDDDGHPDEIFIMDTNDVNTAKNVIRLNKNGIGFSKTGYSGPFTNAWTIDGNLVASYVTAGSMLADRVRGGQLIIGGAGTAADGTIVIKTSDDKVIARFSKDGLTIGGFSVSADGDITTSDATIRFGETTWIDDMYAEFGNWVFDGDSDEFRGPASEQYWDGSGNLHTGEIWLNGDSWWKGWSVTEVCHTLWDKFEDLYNYVHSGSWNPSCPTQQCPEYVCECESGYCQCDTFDDTICSGCDDDNDCSGVLCDNSYEIPCSGYTCGPAYCDCDSGDEDISCPTEGNENPCDNNPCDSCSCDGVVCAQGG